MVDFTLQKKEWESNFFNKKILELVDWKELNNFELALGTLEYDLIECNLSFNRFRDLAALENIGFKTIDSRITFLTLINTEDSRFLSRTPGYLLRPYEAKDFESILAMTHSHLTYNDNFISRYKNESFFPKDSAVRYFSKWIDFSINSPNSITIVSEFKGELVGFFIIEKKNAVDGIPVWKGRLTAVDKDHRGKRLHLSMQTKIFELIGVKEFYLDNTTQLSNVAVIKNHIKSNRALKSMSLNLFLANV